MAASSTQTAGPCTKQWQRVSRWKSRAPPPGALEQVLARSAQRKEGCSESRQWHHLIPAISSSKKNFSPSLWLEAWPGRKRNQRRKKKTEAGSAGSSRKPSLSESQISPWGRGLGPGRGDMLVSEVRLQN